MSTAPVAKPAFAEAPAIPSGVAPASRAIPIWYRSPWKWFFSIRVGVSLLFLLMIASIIGTTIDPLPRAQALIFYTWWYQLLLLALAVNMSCATTKTIIQKLLPTHRLRVHHEPGFYAMAALSEEIPFRGTAAEAAKAFNRQGFKVRVENNAGAARTGWWSRFGAPISHLGMVIVLLAGFASAFVAREGVVQIPEGRSATTMQMRGSEEIVPLGFTLTVDDFSTGFFPRTRIPSHYTSTISTSDGANVLFAGPVEVNHSPKVMGWNIHQTSYQELPTLARYEVTIAGEGLSEPIKAEISPGQSLKVPGHESLKLAVDQQMNWTLSNNTHQLAKGALMPDSMKDASLTIVANRFEPDFVLGEDRQITSRSQELNNPALHVTLKSDGEPVSTQWIFGRDDMKAFSHAPSGHFKVELVDVQRTEAGDAFVVAVTDGQAQMVIGRAILVIGEEQPLGDPHANCEEHCATVAATDSTDWSVTLGSRVPAYATVLSISRNPTIPTIYFGCVLMMIGLMISFFVPRRDVWFQHDAEKGALRVVAHYRHISDQFDRTTRAVLARLTTSEPSTSQSQEQ